MSTDQQALTVKFLTTRSFGYVTGPLAPGSSGPSGTRDARSHAPERTEDKQLSHVAAPTDARAQLEARLTGLCHLLSRFEGVQRLKKVVLQGCSQHFVGYKVKWRAGMYWFWVLMATVVLTIIVAIIFIASMSDWHAAYQADPTLEPPVGITAFFCCQPLLH